VRVVVGPGDRTGRRAPRARRRGNGVLTRGGRAPEGGSRGRATGVRARWSGQRRGRSGGGRGSGAAGSSCRALMRSASSSGSRRSWADRRTPPQEQSESSRWQRRQDRWLARAISARNSSGRAQLRTDRRRISIQQQDVLQNFVSV
jgi:hypothetical protein